MNEFQKIKNNHTFFINYFWNFNLCARYIRASIERKLPKLQTSDVNTAIRGNIVTKDGFSISSSQKLYKVMLDTRNIDPNKKEMFIKLYSLYSGDDPNKVRKIINGTKGIVTLSYSIDAKGATYLQELSRKLNRKSILVSYLAFKFAQ